MMLVWDHTEKNPERDPVRQPHPVLATVDTGLQLLKALGDNVGWRGRILYLHTDSEEPRPESAIAVLAWAKVDDEWKWVADGPHFHGFLRDSAFDWVERGMNWTREQKLRAIDEMGRRGWIRPRHLGL